MNKRVYSDKYDKYLDKSYQVSDDVEFMLHAYRRLLQTSPNEHASRASAVVDGELDNVDQQQQQHTTNNEGSSRRLLANRLNKLAKLGGRQSRQLIDLLRQTLHMDQLEWARYRALRLVKPTGKLSGRFTCSVSSLDSDDLRSTRMIVYGKLVNVDANNNLLANIEPS